MRYAVEVVRKMTIVIEAESSESAIASAQQQVFDRQGHDLNFAQNVQVEVLWTATDYDQWLATHPPKPVTWIGKKHGA